MKLVAGLVPPTYTYIRIPARLISSIVPPALALLTSAHTTAYRSPGLAVAGIATVMVSVAVLPAGMSMTGRLTVVQVDRSSAVRAGAPTKEPWEMVAAAG